MKRSISDLLDQYPAEEMELGVKAPYSPSRIKELTMRKIETTDTPKPRLRPPRLLIAAAVVAIISVTAFAAGRIFGAGDFFREFFAPEDRDLSPGQVAAIDRIGHAGENGEIPAAVTSNGATITPVAAIADANIYYLRLHIEAPEGIILPDEEPEQWYYQLSNPDTGDMLALEAETPFTYFSSLTVLPDENDKDNQKDFVVTFETEQLAGGHGVAFNDGASKRLHIGGLWMQDGDKTYREVFTGDFPFDIGLSFRSQVLPLDAAGLTWYNEQLAFTNTIESLVLSPLSLTYSATTDLPENDFVGAGLGPVEIVLKNGEVFYSSSAGEPQVDIREHLARQGTVLPENRDERNPLSGYLPFPAPLDLSEVDYVRYGEHIIPVTIDR